MSERGQLRRRISAVDFALFELVLFLDTHPDDVRAMRMRDQYKKKRDELVAEYESHFGPYVVTADDVTGDQWTWIDNPWPWDYVPDT